ncbi:vanomycin resistance protein VanB [Actinotalea ferrariae CF5-4]|uniref:Vanomycin resistance protein VanB n=1 Tax=Actinotalea ferrariae CF5-4 TaxID=948458 RepID=A0A021VRW1_9CELL|nr:VanW family protein [Actinotalea ferrariae]EYR63871.1 vanomycin resistance protein VanB [Actinotalea ferrariae CF5-4]
MSKQTDQQARVGGGSPMDAFPDEPARRSWPRAVAIVAAVLVVVAAAYVGALWAWGDTVPRGTTVAGVAIGGLSSQEAEERLTADLGPATQDPIPVAVGERRTTVDPATAGLELDVPATVDGLTGFSLAPSRLWQHLAGVGEADAVTRVDEDALGRAVEDLDVSLGTAPVDATLGFVDGQPSATPAAAGTELDAEAAREVLSEQWLTAARPVELPSRPVEPTVTDDDVQRALTGLARPLVDAPVAVSVAGQLAELPVDVLAATATFVVTEDGDLELEMDGEALSEAVLARTTNLLTPATDASFAFEGGVPVIVPGVAGSSIDPQALAEGVIAAGTGRDEDRTVEVELVQVDPAQSTAALEQLGVTTKVSEFSTPVTSDADRTHNLVVGASKVNGTLIRPGEVFSLTDTLAPITPAGGYREAGVVVNGVLTDGVGGGLSQMGTTVYNAGFFAGLEDVEHRPHSYWFSRYPEGREATIYEGVLDVKIGNNTPYGVLLQSWVADGRLWVAAWSTPHWEVQHSTSGRSEVVQPTTVYSTAPDCIAQAAGNPGFRVTVTRRLLLQGEVQSEESDTWRYQPQNAVVCGPAPGTEPAPAPTPPPG